MIAAWIALSYIGWANYAKASAAKTAAERDTQTAIAKRNALSRDIDELTDQRNTLKAQITGLTKPLSDCLERTTRTESPDQAQTTVSAFFAGDAPASIPPRVYIHIAADDQRPEAKRISALLQTNGYVVPFIRKVESPPNLATLKYFHSDNAALSLLEPLKAILSQGGMVTRNGPMDTPVDRSKFRPAHFELWFPKER
jgi:hypothetical protein